MIDIICEDCKEKFSGNVNEFLCPLCALRRRAAMKKNNKSKGGSADELPVLRIESSLR